MNSCSGGARDPKDQIVCWKFAICYSILLSVKDRRIGHVSLEVCSRHEEESIAVNTRSWLLPGLFTKSLMLVFFCVLNW